MNVIRFEIVESQLEYQDSGIRILIDGVDLIDLVREYEAPFAEAEGHLDIAGQYAGLQPRSECDRKHSAFLGTRSFDSDGRGAIFTCGDCGEVGCWPLLCRVEVADATVTWSDFCQPHRLGNVYSLPSGDTFGSPEVWDYSKFGPFVFDREKYLEAAEVLWICDGECDPYFDRIDLVSAHTVAVLDLEFALPEGWTGSRLVPIRGMPYPGAIDAMDLQEPSGVAHDLSVLVYPPGGGPVLPAGLSDFVQNLIGGRTTVDASQALIDLAQGERATLHMQSFGSESSLIARIPRESGVIEVYATGPSAALDHVHAVLEAMVGALCVSRDG